MIVWTEKPIQAALALLGVTASWSAEALSLYGAFAASCATAAWFGAQALRSLFKLHREWVEWRERRRNWTATTLIQPESTDLGAL